MINKTIRLFILFTLVSCDLETNTVNPQMSKTISESRQYDLLLSVGSPVDDDGNDFIKEVWLEKSWKNSIKNGKKYRELLGSINLVASLNEKVSGRDSTDFWYIIDTVGSRAGSGNGVYDLHVAKLVDSIQLFLLKGLDSKPIDLGVYKFRKVQK
ncbi:hypothetical protein [Sphingobacterium sp. LRF_L2]|uniref:hypothetical protein n=1 Tax=Sphingobacterium sp. LRF_L2 TaxID=3369421 RepID=UPI003F6085AF